MNKYRKKRPIAMLLCSILLLTVFIAAGAQAQTTAASDNRSETRSGLVLAPRFKIALWPAGFRLRSATSSRINTGSSSNTINLMPMAAGPNLQVLGSGTAGRLTKWTGLTSSNSFIGDSSIFESKSGTARQR